MTVCFIRIYEDNAKPVKLDDERFAMMSKNYTDEQKDLKAEVIESATANP
ncbi:MAG: hypothetical protein ACLRSD_01440 [Oscillibacter sp.]